MRKFAILIFSVFFLCLILGFFLIPSYSITVTEEQINQSIEDRLPFKADQAVGSTTINSHTIALSDGDRIAATWEMEKTGLLFNGDFTATALLHLHYDDGAFYLKDLNYDDVQFAILEEGADAQDTTKRDLADVVLQGLGGATVRNDDLKEVLGGILSAILNAFPIFDLRSLDGNLPLVALVLADVGVSDGQITATFSLKMLIRQFGAAVLFLLVMLLYVGRTAPLRRNT